MTATTDDPTTRAARRYDGSGKAPGYWPRVAMSTIRQRAHAAGSHWFEADTMRFFRSRVGAHGYRLPDGGAVFVSSEKAPHGERRYSVRLQTPDGHIAHGSALVDANGANVGEFQRYDTHAGADGAARRVAAERWAQPAQEETQP